MNEYPCKINWDPHRCQPKVYIMRCDKLRLTVQASSLEDLANKIQHTLGADYSYICLVQESDGDAYLEVEPRPVWCYEI